MPESRGWYSRKYLPHFDGGATSQSICFHLYDSIPHTVIAGWTSQLSTLTQEACFEQRRRLAEAYLHRGEGKLWLQEPALATMVENALLFFNGQRYQLHAWVIMPNHVHALFTPMAPYSQQKIVASWKSFTANQANRYLSRTGHFWYPETYDRYIRNETHFNNVKSYIELNPVKAGLVTRPEDWPWSSARFNHQKGGPECMWER